MAERLKIAVSQRQLADLLRVGEARISQATHRGIVHRVEGSTDYDLDSAIGEWLAYERRQSEKSEQRSELERQKVRLMRARAAVVERKLAILDGGWTETDTALGAFAAVCSRIRVRFQSSLSRLGRGCYYAKSLQESVDFAGKIFEDLLGELSALDTGPIAPLEVVRSLEAEEPKEPMV